MMLNGRGLPGRQKYPIGIPVRIKPPGCGWYFSDHIEDAYYLTNQKVVYKFRLWKGALGERELEQCTDPLFKMSKDDIFLD